MVDSKVILWTSVKGQGYKAFFANKGDGIKWEYNKLLGYTSLRLCEE